MAKTIAFWISAALLVAVSYTVLSLKLEWMYSTALVFFAALLFAYAGGAPDPVNTLFVSHNPQEADDESEMLQQATAGQGHSHGAHSNSQGHESHHAGHSKKGYSDDEMPQSPWQ